MYCLWGRGTTMGRGISSKNCSMRTVGEAWCDMCGLGSVVGLSGLWSVRLMGHLSPSGIRVGCEVGQGALKHSDVLQVIWDDESVVEGARHFTHGKRLVLLQDDSTQPKENTESV